MAYGIKSHLGHVVGLGPEANFTKHVSKPISTSSFIVRHGHFHTAILTLLAERNACNQIVRAGGSKLLVRALQLALLYKVQRYFLVMRRAVARFPDIPLAPGKIIVKLILDLGARITELIMRGGNVVFNWFFDRIRAKEDALVRRAGLGEKVMVGALYAAYMAATFVGVYALGEEEVYIIAEEVISQDEIVVITEVVDHPESVSHIEEVEEIQPVIEAVNIATEEPSEPEDASIAKLEEVSHIEIVNVVEPVVEDTLIANEVLSEPEFDSIADVVGDSEVSCVEEVSHIEEVEDTQSVEEDTVIAEESFEPEVSHIEEVEDIQPAIENTVVVDESSEPEVVEEESHVEEDGISNGDINIEFNFFDGPTVDEVPSACDESLDSALILDALIVSDSETDTDEDRIDADIFVDDMALDKSSSESESSDSEIIEDRIEEPVVGTFEVVMEEEEEAHEEENNIFEYEMDLDGGRSIASVMSSIDLDISSFIDEPDTGSLRESQSSPAVVSKLGETGFDFDELEYDLGAESSTTEDVMSFAYASIAPSSPTSTSSFAAVSDALGESEVPSSISSSASIDQSSATTTSVDLWSDSVVSSSTSSSGSSIQDLSDIPQNIITNSSIHNSIQSEDSSSTTTTDSAQIVSAPDDQLVISSIFDVESLFEPTSEVPVVKISPISVPRPAIEAPLGPSVSFTNKLDIRSCPIFVPGKAGTCRKHKRRLPKPVVRLDSIISKKISEPSPPESLPPSDSPAPAQPPASSPQQSPTTSPKLPPQHPNATPPVSPPRSAKKSAKKPRVKATPSPSHSTPRRSSASGDPSRRGSAKTPMSSPQHQGKGLSSSQHAPRHVNAVPGPSRSRAPSLPSGGGSDQERWERGMSIPCPPVERASIHREGGRNADGVNGNSKVKAPVLHEEGQIDGEVKQAKKKRPRKRKVQVVAVGSGEKGNEKANDHVDHRDVEVGLVARDCVGDA